MQLGSWNYFATELFLQAPTEDLLKTLNSHASSWKMNPTQQYSITERPEVSEADWAKHLQQQYPVPNAKSLGAKIPHRCNLSKLPSLNQLHSKRLSNRVCGVCVCVCVGGGNFRVSGERVKRRKSGVIQCFKCLKIGHVSHQCQSQQKCGRSGD